MQYFQQLIESDIFKKRADINWVLNEIKKSQEFEGIARKYLQNYLNKLITEKKIINKINLDQDSYTVNRDILKIYELDQAPSPVSFSNSSFDNSLFSILPPLVIEIPFSSCQD